ncbi:programmed cell death protein 2 [Cynara cardunculus var. scolymus]|uniref:programmed cell death protein 2 n=1 Tax=Cynara cardunculus var. scolymus TaxID=59895 RepID=UPI000D62E8EB|nr:programmed cell death protein 2 [Cynara cardunculus var. scolymus]
MSRELSRILNDDSLDKFTTMRISSLDGDEDEEFAFDNDDDDDEEEEDEDEEQAPVVLGFVEKPKHEWSLLRHLFPSKAGGTPAWLDPINLPSGKSCLCDICGEPLRFLLQAYAPLSAKDSTFHRTLFVFMCPSMSCLLQDQHEQWKHRPEKGSRSIKVFRCQLARNNEFYSTEPPENNGTDKPLGRAAPLCGWCGTWKGDKVCSNCKRARYCSKMHQTIHWSSAHKSRCRTSDLPLQASNSGSTNCSEDIPKAASNVTWPEYEIINEDESEFDIEMSNSDAFGKALHTNNEDEGDAKSWASFQKRISRAPDQVLRYSRHETSKPLWPMLTGQPSKVDIPKCSSCCSDRSFEFQILPQLLYFFDVKNDANSLDWATIVVYTCEASCNGSLAYEEEFAWVQLTPQSR